ncbi:MAG: aminotransferase class III-fold pyridoxal phosphate-dependent enzyme [Gammaproteobacteria bacterium]|nr:aminotransferase class III-fold pyridoxal phosphate-dependent enzyme [Gammaproteobacteria bacterium]MBI5615996.1 aminotransferase class III-fold pyridoxal phosphate-dependent enzyme [Gammaproteobacteria bacterium]
MPSEFTPEQDERLPLILGFQPVTANTVGATRFMDYGKGVYVYDTDGREYLEATATFYVAALGYQHEELIEAITAQYRQLPFFVSAMNRTGRTSLELADRLRELVPIADAHLLFGTTGSEALDFLTKLLRAQAVARGRPERTTIFSRHGSYHGATLAAASLTGGHHAEFALPLPGFRHVAQPDYHGARLPGEAPRDYAARLARELESRIAQEPPDTIAAFVAEPVSFSAGFMLPPAEYFPALTAVLDAHGIALVADEVVTGIGRLGDWFGTQALGLAPAHLTLGKALTGGYFPLSAIAIGPELYADLESGSTAVGTFAHASTYAAHPVGAAAALKVLEIIERDGLVAHGARMGERLAAVLERLRGHPLVGDVRTLGLAGCLDFLRRDADDRPRDTAAAAEETCRAVNAALFDRGVVGRAAGRGLVIAPPLIVSPGEIDDIGARLAAALDAVGG